MNGTVEEISSYLWIVIFQTFMFYAQAITIKANYISVSNINEDMVESGILF